jgi:hypothetical protein
MHGQRETDSVIADLIRNLKKHINEIADQAPLRGQVRNDGYTQRILNMMG